jgi:hypothetical protein
MGGCKHWARQTADIPVTFAAYAALFMGQTDLSSVNVRAAREWLAKALRTFERFEGQKFGLIICRSELVAALAACGEFSYAACQLRALIAERNPHGFMESRCTLAEAWVSAAEGAVTEAIDHARRAAAAAQRRGHFSQEVVGLHTAVRFGDTTVAARLAPLCAVVEGHRYLAGGHRSATS